MTIYQRIIITAIPGLMFGIIPAHGIDLRFGWQLVSVWLAAVVFVCAVLRSWWLRLFFVLCFLAVLRYGPIATSYLTLLTIAVFLAATEGSREIGSRRIYNAMTVAAMLLLSWGLLQAAGITRYFLPPGAASNLGPFNINSASAFFAMCLPVFFCDRRITLLYKFSFSARYLLPVPVLGLIMSRSTTGFLAAVVACIVYGALGGVSKKGFAGGLAALVLAGAVFFTVIDPPGDKDMSRPIIWGHIIKSYKSEMFGRGLGSFEQIFPVMIMSDKGLIKRIGESRVAQAHNEYLQAGFEIGLPALGLILVFLAATYRRAWLWREFLTEHERMFFSGLAATAVAAAGFHTFHVAPTALLGCVWIGMALGCSIIESRTLNYGLGR